MILLLIWWLFLSIIIIIIFIIIMIIIIIIIISSSSSSIINIIIITKVKTELELEAEYKHILYPPKKKKATKLSTPKKKKKISAAAAATPASSPLASAKKPIKGLRQRRRIKPIRRLRNAGKNSAAAVRGGSGISTRAAAGIVSPPAASKPAPETRTRSGVPHAAANASVATEAWQGKRASKKAYDRTDRSRRPFTSSKIEDVTGRYGKVDDT